jgi:hypothetical protein
MRLLRAVLVGFALGFALVGVLRLAQPADVGPQLTGTQLSTQGAAVDIVRLTPCPTERRDQLILI